MGESCCAVAMTTMADSLSVEFLAELLAPQDEDANEEHEVRELIRSTFTEKGFAELSRRLVLLSSSWT